jgi:ABC-type cobalamin/Fe3+-siderophores transport system ATPase subunit
VADSVFASPPDARSDAILHPVKIELRNFRAFDDSRPATWKLPNGGFVAFVGINNSGKSSLLRFFHEARPAFGALDTLTNADTQAMFGGTPHQRGLQSVADPDEVFCNRNSRDMTATFLLDPPGPSEEIGTEPSALRLRWHRANAGTTIEVEYNHQPIPISRWDDDGQPVVSAEGGRVTLDLRRYQQAFRDLSESIYLGPFRNAVNVGGSASYYDLQIGEQFIAQWDDFKTGNNRAQNRAAIAVERELQQIFGLRKLEINAAPGNQTMQIIADDEPYQLQEQGAGLAQFIVVFAFVATRRPTYIFIDEPELNLHPALQLDFLTTLAGYCTRGLAFSTHSIGLARAVGQDIYSVRRLPDDSRELRPLEATRNYVEFLGELSLSGYAELGFNRVVLVEGRTEVPTIQRWLRLYGIEHEVVLLPLGGSTLINADSAPALAEIKRITEDVSVVIDSEREAEGEPLDGPRQAFVDACEGLGFTVLVLRRRAMENYFADAAVKAVKGPEYRALEEFEALSSVEPRWGKNENWRIAAEMTRQDLDATDLGHFLRQLAEQHQQ